jgi:hypothetical protein
MRTGLDSLQLPSTPTWIEVAAASTQKLGHNAELRSPRLDFVQTNEMYAMPKNSWTHFVMQPARLQVPKVEPRLGSQRWSN